MVIEVNFPRGGRKPPSNTKFNDFRNDDCLFSRNKKKYVKKANIHTEENNIFDSNVSYVEHLSKKTLQDGMVILGCIKEIQKVALEISLPGRLWGKVFANNLSKPYTKNLQTGIKQDSGEDNMQLSKLFTLGQCVAVKVLNINDSKFDVILTMMPQQINANISHINVKPGMTLWGAISECEDHGYVVDLGINNCRAFLKKDKCEKENYVVGELLWFCVTKSEVLASATTVMLSTKSDKIKEMKIIKEISLDHLLPGMQVDFTVSQILKNGLEGKFLNNCTGYIDVRHFDKSSQVKNDYSIDNILQARILYVMPLTKVIYFTLKSLEPHQRDKIRDGTIKRCKVTEITHSGMYVKIKEDIGFVPSYRANKTNYQDETFNYRYLKHHYRIKSMHYCRILNYDYFEQIYICSMEKDLVDESTIFSLKDLEVGQKVTSEIKEVLPNGIVVRVGNIMGFIKNEHICDTVLNNYNNIKNRLKVGQDVETRVWILNVDRRILYLTMRPSLLNAEHILSNYEDANQNDQFLGVVRQINNNGLLVEFFGDVHGWIRNSQIFNNIKNTHLVFKIGQLVKCTVLNCKKKRLTLTMHSASEISEDVKPELKLGEHVEVVVSSVADDGMYVTVKNTDIHAFIPILHLSKFPKLTPLLLKMYKSGDEISDLVCINNNEDKPILSLRNLDLVEDNIQTIKSLKSGTIICCSVSTTDNIGINLEGPINNFKKTITVLIENISDSRKVLPSDFKINQMIYAKVFTNTKNSITASTKLSDVWNYDINSAIEYFSEYLKDVVRIRSYLKSIKHCSACLNLGDIVSGIVKEINENGSYIVELQNGIKAICQPENGKENLTIGTKVEAVVLWWNFEDNIVDIALSTKLISRINKLQNGVMNIPAGVTNKSNSHAEVLLVKNDFVVGVLRGAAGKRQLIFFPCKMHPNDFTPNLKNYIVGDYINIQVNKIENGFIIGLLKQTIKDMNFKNKLSMKRKKEINGNTEDQPKLKHVKLETNEDKNRKKENNIKEEKKKQKKEDKIYQINENITNITISSDQEIEDMSVNGTEIINNVNKKKIKKDTLTKSIKEKETSKEENKKEKQSNIKNEEQIIEKIKKRKFNDDIHSNSDNKKIKKEQLSKNEPTVLPGAENFWNISQEIRNVTDESSDDDEQTQEELEKQQKKKRMTPAERTAAAKIEEERIRKIELELADAETKPKTADQFDRLVLANPNNSMLWINYMAFHLEATEIEKARSVAKRALSTIEFREEQEKLNVWIALLNLENRYGTKESFASELDEAVKMNDSLPVYLQALNILSETKKILEFTELLRNVSRKFKQEFKMWVEAAEACYKCNLKDEARNLMQRSLKSLEEKQHINLLVQFAFMEARYNEPERAEAILEKIVASYPRRVDVWTSYVDMLIKGNRIHIARNVLGRAIGQKLPARKMKTLFTKYVQFESKYGDEESVNKVRQLAANYVKAVIN